MHAIDETTGRPAIAYINEAPWHELGTQMSPGQSLEEWLKNAGLEWEARMVSLSYRAGKDYVSVPNKKAIYRSDTHGCIGVVGDKYKIVQPKEVMEFYKDLVDDFGFQIEVAGSLFEGRRIWALANTHEAMTLPGNDESKLFMLLTTSFDGSMPTIAKMTSVRVVCNNTLSMGLKEGGHSEVRVPHNTFFVPEAVKKELKIEERWKNFNKIAEDMSKYTMSKAETTDFLCKVYDITDKVSKIRRERFLADMQKSLFESPGAQMASARGTLWGALNAVTWDMDHRPRRKEDNRMNEAMFGAGDALKNKAWALAAEKVAA